MTLGTSLANVNLVTTNLGGQIDLTQRLESIWFLLASFCNSQANRSYSKSRPEACQGCNFGCSNAGKAHARGDGAALFVSSLIFHS